MAAAQTKYISSSQTISLLINGRKSEFSTLQGLKNRAYRTWESLHQIHAQPFELTSLSADYIFKNYIRENFGDLREKITWENVWCALYAQLLSETNDDNVYLIRRTFGRACQKEGWEHLLPRVLDNFLEQEESLDCICNGLERILLKQNKFPKELEAFAQALHSSKAFRNRS